jgi:hypothetical protein
MDGMTEQPQEAIIIEDDEETPERYNDVSPRLRSTPRHDYSYQEYQKVIGDAISTKPSSRKRKRNADTADLSSSLVSDASNSNIFFSNVRKG